MTKLISKRSLLLVGSDLAAIYLAFQIGGLVRTGAWNQLWVKPYAFYFSLAIFPMIFYIFDLYHPFKYFKPSILIDILVSVNIGSIFLAAVSYADKDFTQPRSTFVISTLILIPFIYLIRRIYDFLFKSKFLDRKTLIVGTDSLAYQIAEVIKKTPHSGMEVVGLVSEAKRNGAASSTAKKKDEAPVVGSLSNLLSLIDWYGVEMVILASSHKEEISEASVMAELLSRKVVVTSAIHLFERLSGEVPYRFFGSHYLLGLMSQVRMRPYLKIKRMLDVVFGLVLLILLLPPLVICSVILCFDNPREILFIQRRIGKDSKPFDLIKLRSMKKSKNGRLVVTGFGAFIRRYRIDEIPQLINVLKGDMSLVGPRPEIPYFVNRCRRKIPFYDAVFAVKPGLTGWAQVRFRYTTSVGDYDQKFRYNLYYLKNISLMLDFLIILKTIRIVLLGKGQ